jgi:hypothetical protein
MGPVGFWLYWSRVFLRAFGDSFGFLGCSRKRVFLSLLFLAGTVAVSFLVGEPHNAAEALQKAGYAVVVWVAVFLLLFLVHLARSPWVLHNEAVEACSKARDEIMAELNAIKSELATRKSQESTEEKRDASHSALLRLKQELKAFERQLSADYPLVSRGHSEEADQQNLNRKRQGELNSLYARAQQEAANVGRQRLFSDPELEKELDLDGIRRATERLLESVDTILKNLG